MLHIILLCATANKDEFESKFNLMKKKILNNIEQHYRNIYG